MGEEAVRDESNDQLIVLCKYQGQQLRLLVDTAAQVTVLWSNVTGVKKLEKRKYQLFGLGNNNVHSFGRKNMEIKIDNIPYKIDAHITDVHHRAYDGLLGMDFLKPNQATIRIEDQKLELAGNTHQLHLVSDVLAGRVIASCGVMNHTGSRALTPATLVLSAPACVPPSTNKVVHLVVPPGLPYSQLYAIHPLEENRAMDDLKCYVPRSILPIIRKDKQFVVPVVISNFSSLPVKLIRGTRIAEIETITASDIVEPSEFEKSSGDPSQAPNSDVPSVETKKHLHVAAAIRDIKECAAQAARTVAASLSAERPSATVPQQSPEQAAETGSTEEVQIDEELIRANVDTILLNKKLSHLNELNRMKFKRLIVKFKDLFDNKMKTPAPTTAMHRIRTTDDIPINRRGYRIPQGLQSHVDKIIEDQINNDIITQCNSPWGAGMVLVPKKSADGSIEYRCTIDFRFLNSKTITELWPVPLITEAINNLAGCSFFSVIDLKSAFHQIPIHPADQHKTAFVVPSGKYAGTYMYKYMAMGLKNAGNSFQRFADGLLRGLQPMVVMAYCDDWITYSVTIDQNIEYLGQVFERLQSAHLTVNLSKCKFGVTEICYLGHRISKHGCTPDPSLVEKIKNFPEPDKLELLQRMTGLFSYYRRYVKNYADIARPLTDLLKANRKYEFTAECKIAMKIIINIISSYPCLAFPDFKKNFILTCDASNYACGSVLSQIGDDGLEHPVAFASRRFTPREQVYTTMEREFLGVVWSVEHFRYFLLGQNKFTIITDHAALQYIHTMANPVPRVLRWIMKLAEFNYVLKHRPGKLIPHADAMSRCINVLHIHTDEELIEQQKKDRKCQKWEKSRGFQRRGDILFKITKEGPRIVIPASMRAAILQQNHDSLLAAHCGTASTQRRVATQYWWPGRSRDVIRFIKSCDACNRRSNAGSIKMPLQQLPETYYPFQKIAMDITQLPETDDGYKYILTIVDHFSRYLVMIPMKSQKAIHVARKLNRKFILVYGVPEICLTDQGQNFLSELLKELCRLFDITKLRTVAYWPQGNGRCEATHKTIKKYLSYFVDDNQKNWKDILPYVVAAYNSKAHSATQVSPHMVVFGRRIKTPFDFLANKAKIQHPDIQEQAQKLEELWQDVQVANEKAFLAQAAYYNRDVKEHNFRVGDKVMVKNNRILPQQSAKLSKKWVGPFEILEFPSDVLLKIKIPSGTSIVHASRCKPPCIARPGDLSPALCPQPPPSTPAAAAACPPPPAPSPPAPQRKKRQQPAAPAARARTPAAPQRARQTTLRPGLRATIARNTAGFYSK